MPNFLVPTSARIAALTAACALLPTVASASAPAGVWGLVHKVEVDPAADPPNQVRLDGVFILANEKPDFAGYPGYSIPAYGYMFYACPEGQQKVCAQEWADLTAATLADNNCRGWGGNQLPDNGSVRAVDDPPANPDAYPLSMGVVQGFAPCDALHAWVLENPPVEAESTGGEGGSTIGGESTDGDTDGGTAGGTAGETGTAGGTGGTAGETGEATGGASGTTIAPETSGNPDTTGNVATGGPTTGAPETSGDTSGDGTSSGGATDGSDGDKGGCGCDADAQGSGPAALVLLGALLGLRRRRR